MNTNEIVGIVRIAFIIRLKDEILRYQLMKTNYNEPVDDLILYYETTLDKIKSCQRLSQDKRWTDFFAVTFLYLKCYCRISAELYDDIFNEIFDNVTFEEMIEKH